MINVLWYILKLFSYVFCPKHILISANLRFAGLGPQLLWLCYICKESEIIFCKNEPWCLIFCISTEKPLVHLSRSAAAIFSYPASSRSRRLSFPYVKIETERVTRSVLQDFHSGHRGSKSPYVWVSLKTSLFTQKSTHPPLPYFYPSIFLFHKMQSKMKTWCPNFQNQGTYNYNAY